MGLLASNQASAFRQRALITFTLGPVAVFVIYQGGWIYFVPVTAILLLATVEYGQLMRLLGWHISLPVLVPAVLAQLIVAQWYDSFWWPLSLLAGVFWVTAYALWLFERGVSQTVPSDWLAMIGAVLLLGWVGSHFFRLRGLPEMAWQWSMLAMVSTWLADTGAYLVGKFLAGNVLGRHKLSPRLSPNKTIEGLVGGILVGTATSATLAFAFDLPYLPALVLGLLVSIVSPLGDLAISLLKRSAGVKDSGTLLPGHGGALDRIDSLLWSVAMAYYLVGIVEHTM